MLEQGEVMIVSQRGEPIRSSQPLRKWLRDLEDRLGLERGVHIVRYTFATQALNNAPLSAMSRRSWRYLHRDSANLDQTTVWP